MTMMRGMKKVAVVEVVMMIDIYWVDVVGGSTG
jgi:hypothetical protein